MREIVLDTETTGFEPETGDRIVEIGAVELHNHMPTGRTYHQYINPKRSMPQEAFEVHGIGHDLLEPPQEAKPGNVTLKDKPVFAEIGDAFLEFVGDAKLVIHNASLASPTNPKNASPISAKTGLSFNVTSPGLASRGQRVEQSPQLWHSQMSALPTSLSFNPQDAAIISLRGKGLLSGAI